MQGLWGQRHLRAWKGEERVQGLRGQQHLRAWKGEEQMQGLLGQQHLPASKAEEQMQGLWGQQLNLDEARIWYRRAPYAGQSLAADKLRILKWEIYPYPQ